MQPLAIAALSSGAVMVLFVTAGLILSRNRVDPRRRTINRWHRHASIPLAAAGLALGAMSRGGGQLPATHDIIYAEAITLLLAALVFAVIGAADASSWTRRGPKEVRPTR